MKEARFVLEKRRALCGVVGVNRFLARWAAREPINNDVESKKLGQPHVAGGASCFWPTTLGTAISRLRLNTVDTSMAILLRSVSVS